MTNRLPAENTALILKVVGTILILSFLLDFLIVMLPLQVSSRPWQVNVSTVLVDRGIVPLLGMGMIFLSDWVKGDRNSDYPPQMIDVRLPVLVFSSVLGLVFLLIFPLHLNNLRQVSAENISQIRQEAQRAEKELQGELSQLQAEIRQVNTELSQLQTDAGKAQLENRRSQAKNQLNQVLANEQSYQQALNDPQVPAEQKELLRKFKANPQELEKFITEQINPQTQANQRLSVISQRQKAANDRLGVIKERQKAAEKRARENAWQSGLRIGVSSLLLSTAYIIIGWTGLRYMTRVGK